MPFTWIVSRRNAGTRHVDEKNNNNKPYIYKEKKLTCVRLFL